MEKNLARGWEHVLDWLDEHKTGVSLERFSIIHGDFHPNNIMLRKDGAPVVIDWRAVTVGDYRVDLAWAILLSNTYTEPGFKKDYPRSLPRSLGARGL